VRILTCLVQVTCMTLLETDSKQEANNKQLVRSFMKAVFNDHRPDRAAEFFAPQAKWHGGNFGVVEGAGNIAGLLQAVLAALPDLTASEQNIVVEGDTVVVRLIVEGTHKGNLLGLPATNRRVRWDAIDMYKISNGKIVDDWASEDALKIVADIGAYIPPWMKSGN
jgi:predicted ester cyclase